MNQIIRSAVHAYVERVVNGSDFAAKVAAAKERAAHADEWLKQRLSLAANDEAPSARVDAS